MGRPNHKNPLAPPIPGEPGPWAMSLTALFAVILVLAFGLS